MYKAECRAVTNKRRSDWSVFAWPEDAGSGCDRILAASSQWLANCINHATPRHAAAPVKSTLGRMLL